MVQEKLFLKGDQIIHIFHGIQCYLPLEWVLHFFIGLLMNGLFITQILLKVRDQSLLKARSYPLFHWMFTGWALYILPTVAFVFSLMKNPNTPLTFSGILLKRTIWTNKNFIRYLFYWCNINRSRCWSGTILPSYVSCYIKTVWT